MATMKLSDVIVPEIWQEHAQKLTSEKSLLVQSGIVRQSELLDQQITQGNKLVRLPFWSDLGGEDEVLMESGAITLGDFDALKELAPVLVRAKGWGAHELAGVLAGSDPFHLMLDRCAQWWARREQQILLSIMSALFDSTAGVLKTHAKDISTESGDAAKISPASVLDTKQLIGDNAGKLTTMIMHSAVYTALQKQNVVAYVPAAGMDMNFPTYLGYKVIVDDSMPYDSETGAYTTYFFGEGAFARGEGAPEALTNVEIARDAANSEDRLYTRRALVLHPLGISWVQPSAYANTSHPTPANADLATPANYQAADELKNIALCALIHKI